MKNYIEAIRGEFISISIVPRATHSVIYLNYNEKLAKSMLSHLNKAQLKHDIFKGIGSVISSDPSFKDGNVSFTTAPLKPLFYSINFNFINLFIYDFFMKQIIWYMYLMQNADTHFSNLLVSWLSCFAHSISCIPPPPQEG